MGWKVTGVKCLEATAGRVGHRESCPTVDLETAVIARRNIVEKAVSGGSSRQYVKYQQVMLVTSS